MKTFLFIALNLLLIETVCCTTYLPLSILQLNDKYSHHILLVEKQSHILKIYKNKNGIPLFIKDYQIVTGKKPGNKLYQGDYRTPEGVYNFSKFIPHSSLLREFGKKGEIYGVGAFVTNYPNIIDQQLKKSGSGIWLHSTNDETRIDKGLDSRGCVVSANDDLIEISKYIELQNTPIIIVDQIKYLDQKNWVLEKKKIKLTINNWLQSWVHKDFNSYISHYHKNYFDTLKGNYKNFYNYKKRLFRKKSKITISISDITIVGTQKYLSVSFEQLYNSNTIVDTGLKTLYLKKDNYYNYKIISEQWSKIGLKKNKSHTSLAFQPRQRFFKSTKNSKNITIENNKEL